MSALWNVSAVLCRCLDRQIYVVATNDPTLELDIENISASDLDLGLLDKKNAPTEPGLYLYTGVGRVRSYDIHDGYTEYDGICRPILPEEMTALLAMTPPRCEKCGDAFKTLPPSNLCEECAEESASLFTTTELSSRSEQ